MLTKHLKKRYKNNVNPTLTGGQHLSGDEKVSTGMKNLHSQLPVRLAGLSSLNNIIANSKVASAFDSVDSYEDSLPMAACG